MRIMDFALWLHAILGFFGALSVFAEGRVDTEAYRCIVPHPSNENWTLEGTEMQYKLHRFFEGQGPPPLEEVFIATQNLSVAVQEELMEQCPGLLISAYIVLAEARLPLSQEESGHALAKADSLANRLSEERYSAEMEVWPIQAALANYQHAAQEAADAQAAGAGKQPSVHFVVCHCRESLEWLDGNHFHLPSPERASAELFIYEKCGYDTDLSTMSRSFRRINTVAVEDGDVRRDECSGYLRHLIDHYGDPADFTLFFQADAADHMQYGYLSLVMRAIELHTLTTPFVHLNHPRLIASLSPCRAEVFRQIFDRPPKRMLGSYCCAQFMVSRQRILANPLERYERMQKMLFGDSPPECHDIPGHSTHCLMFEVYWHVLFGEEDDLPARAENPTLQLFLRTRDLENESYLPPGSLFLKLAAMQE